jgi:hypothetical protein
MDDLETVIPNKYQQESSLNNPSIPTEYGNNWTHFSLPTNSANCSNPINSANHTNNTVTFLNPDMENQVFTLENPENVSNLLQKLSESNAKVNNLNNINTKLKEDLCYFIKALGEEILKREVTLNEISVIRLNLLLEKTSTVQLKFQIDQLRKQCEKLNNELIYYSVYLQHVPALLKCKEIFPNCQNWSDLVNYQL